MKKTALFPLLLSIICLAVALVAGCPGGPKADPAQMEGCKESAKASADACKTCCKAAGATGHMWTSGSGCKCL